MSKDAIDDAKDALCKFVVSLAIADARRDHLVAIGKHKPEERKPKRSSTKEPEDRVTLRFIVDDQD